MLIAVAPRSDAARTALLAEVEEIMRIRHGLTLDEPNDFDLVTQDAALDVWDQVSQATFLALIVISSIALMVGGIGVMAIMTISVTERTREIGLRKALGARRREILFQFLAEAVVLTSLGGILGIALGSAIGVTISLATGFPCRSPGGRSRWASGSPPPSGSSSAWSRRPRRAARSDRGAAARIAHSQYVRVRTPNDPNRPNRRHSCRNELQLSFSPVRMR